jgi:hypothetical protein
VIGFYDIASATNGRVLGYPERISLGDTLLLLALRLHDPSSVAILIKHGADLNQSNAFDQKPMEILFYIHKLIHGIPPDTSNVTNPTKKHADAFFQEQVLVTKKKQYERLLKEIEPIIQVFHHEIQKNVRSELEALYEAHAPDRLSKIDLQMQEFYLKERELLVAVKRKYT